LATRPEGSVLERVVLGISKAFIALAAFAGVWSFLTLYFFACCGVSLDSHLDPAVSPFGYWPTITVLWPAMGLLCILAEGMVRSIRFVIRRLVEGIRAWAP